MESLIAPQGIKLGIFRSLKAGVFPEFPEQGAPQGGVFSPLLANIALNGIEAIHTSIRYADDMVIFLKPKDNAESILAKIKSFLANRGMEISEEKTKLTLATDGFDFLGWHFKVQRNGKFRSTPSEENFTAFKKKVKAIVNNSNYGAEVKSQKLAPIVRGWKNYHQYCKLDGSRFSLWFVQKRAEAIFRKQKTVDRSKTVELVKKAFPYVSYAENSFVNVASDRSPYDGDVVYWSKRNSKLYDGSTATTLKKQNHRCGYCGLALTGEEVVHLHHIDGNHNNWKHKNLIAIHQSCHQYHHMGG